MIKRACKTQQRASHTMKEKEPLQNKTTVAFSTGPIKSSTSDVGITAPETTTKCRCSRVSQSDLNHRKQTRSVRFVKLNHFPL
ncbi:hypothetical protein NQZ68_034796 [Dissostichus eleginoides]|nr:hypothetical protein NQZ68_034796 [Dissostichus eleginoides]